MVKKIQLIRQMGTADCGPACLAMIFAFYGDKIDVNDIKANTRIGRDGLSLAKMKEIVEAYGFIFKAYSNYEIERNIQENCPLIMCTKNNHFVVIEKKVKKGYVVFDPVEGKSIIEFKRIQSTYHDLVILIRPNANTRIRTKSKKSKNSYKLYINYKRFICALFLTMMTQAIVIVPSLLIQKIIDMFGSNSYPNDIIILIGLAIGIGVLYWIGNSAKRYIILLLQNEIYATTIKQMLKKLFKIDFVFFECHTTGDIANRFNSINELYQFISGAAITTLIDILTAIICGIVMVIQSVSLFIIVFIITIIQIVCVVVINKYIRKKTNEYIDSLAKVESILVEALSNIQQIRCMHIDAIIKKNVQSKYDKSIGILKVKTHYSNQLESITMAVNIITPLILYIIGGLYVQKGYITLGVLIGFVNLSSYFISPFSVMSMVLPQIGIIRETMYRLREFMEFKNMQKNGTKKIDNFKNIKMQKVNFSYSEKNGVQDINIELNKGEKIAIVGSSGSGKTTIIKLLLNVIQQYNGRIEINGIDIKDIDPDSLSNIFSVVTQMPVAINGTIRENVDMLQRLSDDEIWELLDMVDMKCVVKKFPLGLNTYIGENGQNISGGQKQRLAIVRAMSNKPEVVIFDEATSNIDSLTERKIYKRLKEERVSQIIITHRLKAVEDADRIYVIDDGNIVEMGKHEELMEQQGIYYLLQNDKE